MFSYEERRHLHLQRSTTLSAEEYETGGFPARSTTKWRRAYQPESADALLGDGSRR